MTKQFDVAKIARLTEIKEGILDLLDEAASLVRAVPRSSVPITCLRDRLYGPG